MPTEHHGSYIWTMTAIINIIVAAAQSMRCSPFSGHIHHGSDRRATNLNTKKIAFYGFFLGTGASYDSVPSAWDEWLER